MTAAKKIPPKEKKFLLEYLKDFNGTQAAIRAGYSKRSAASTASEILRNPNVSAHIQTELADMGMQINEILGRLTLQARADLSEFMEFGLEPVLDRNARFVGNKQVVHIKQTYFEQYGHLIKSISSVRGGGFRIEMYSAQEALQLLGKAKRLFIDSVDVTSGGEPILKRVGVNADRL